MPFNANEIASARAAQNIQGAFRPSRLDPAYMLNDESTIAVTDAPGWKLTEQLDARTGVSTSELIDPSGTPQLLHAGAL